MWIFQQPGAWVVYLWRRRIGGMGCAVLHSPVNRIPRAYALPSAKSRHRKCNGGCNITHEMETDVRARASGIPRTRGSGVVVKNAHRGRWAYREARISGAFPSAEAKSPVSPWALGLVGTQPLPRSVRIWILGGIEEWRDEGRLQIPGNIEIDSLWAVGTLATLEKLITACFQPETVERARQKEWRGMAGNLRTGVGEERWQSTHSFYLDAQRREPSSSPCGRFRTGRCAVKRVENERCGSPQSKPDALVKPVGYQGGTKFFLGNMAPGTRTGYWRAWNQRLGFAKHRAHSCWLNQGVGGVINGARISRNSYFSTVK